MKLPRDIIPTQLFKVRIWAILFVCILHAATVSTQPEELYLSIHHGRSCALLKSRFVHVGDVIRLSWIHSVELTPWEEDYEVQTDGSLVLKTTRFQSYGAGVPEYGGKFRKEREWMLYENINRRFPALNWIHSRTVKFEIRINDSVFVKPEDLPHHEPLKLTIVRETPP